MFDNNLQYVSILTTYWMGVKSSIVALGKALSDFLVVISGSVAVAMQPTQIQNNPEEEFLVSLKPWPGHFQILRFFPS